MPPNTFVRLKRNVHEKRHDEGHTHIQTQVKCERPDYIIPRLPSRLIGSPLLCLPGRLREQLLHYLLPPFPLAD